jgi:cell division protein FtsI/penicillin-binding protein 2
MNNAISSILSPGSTMKLVSAVAGLESKVITPSETIYDKGYYTAIPGVSPSCSIFKSTVFPITARMYPRQLRIHATISSLR